MVSSLGCWNKNRWVWGYFGVDRSTPSFVFAVVTELKGLLSEVFPEKKVTDSGVWQPDRGPGYSTNSGYKLLIKDYKGPTRDSDMKSAFDFIWKSNVPYRIKAFGWWCLWNRLLTKYLLFRRGIPLSTNNQLCVFCSIELETLDHILLGCPFSKLVWKEMFLWCGFLIDLGGLVWNSLKVWCVASKKFGVKKGTDSLLWMAVMWRIWCLRNDIIFNGAKVSLSDLVWDIKLKVWKWFCSGNISNFKCNFYELCKDPMYYLG